MFLFAHGDAQYSAEIVRNNVQITRTVSTCVAHPEQSVTLYHDLTYAKPVYAISVDNTENMVIISFGDEHVVDGYSFSEIESMFVGEDEDDESVDQIKDSSEYYMPNHQWDSKYVYTSQVLKNGLEDLEKANWYLTRLINKLKEAQK